MQTITRRHFVKTSGALSLASMNMFAGCSTQKTQTKSIPLGVQLYSVRTECQKDFPKTLEAIAQIGYDGVEFAGYYDYEAKEIKQLLDDNALKCCGSHTQLDELSEDNFEATMEFNQTIGNSYVIVPWLPEEKRQSVDDWKKLAEFFTEFAEKVKPYGMRIGYHNHGFEFQSMDGQIPWDIFAVSTQNDVILQLDTGNCAHGGGDAYATLKRYPGRAVTIHLKEYSENNPDAILGEGDLPWQDIFTFCETEGGTEWYIIEEEKEIYPPIETIQKCYENFKALKSA